MHLGRRREDGGLDTRLRQALDEIHRPVGNSVPGGRRLRVLGDAARDGDDLHAVDPRQRVEMLVGKGPFTDHADLHESVSPAILQHHQSVGGVRGRHVIEAVDFVDPLAQRASHHQPHHQLDALRAGLAQVLGVRDADEAPAVSPTSLSMNALIERRVDETRALALQLVRHAARAEHCNPRAPPDTTRRPGESPARV